MIYGRSHSRCVVTPEGRSIWRMALGKRSRRHQERMKDAWRASWAGPGPWHWPLALRVIAFDRRLRQALHDYSVRAVGR